MKKILALIAVTLPLSVSADISYVRAKFISGEDIWYPIASRMDGQEGWVYYTYSIGIDGKVEDIKIIDSNGVSALLDALVKSLESRTYEPARLNGRAVVQHQEISRATYLLTDKPRDTSRKFNSLYKNAKKSIVNGDPDKAWSYIQKLSNYKHRSLYEEFFLQSTLVAYYRSLGNADLAYTHSLRVLDFYSEDQKNKILDDRYFIPFLVEAYKYEVEKMMIGDALGSAEWLQKIDSQNEAVRAVVDHANQLRLKIGGQSHTGKGSITTPVFGGNTGIFKYTLIKSNFRIDGVRGLNSVELLCEDGQMILDFSNENHWTVPEDWGDCFLRFYGDLGANFNVTELPPAQSETASMR